MKHKETWNKKHGRNWIKSDNTLIVKKNEMKNAKSTLNWNLNNLEEKRNLTKKIRLKP